MPWFVLSSECFETPKEGLTYIFRVCENSLKYLYLETSVSTCVSTFLDELALRP